MNLKTPFIEKAIFKSCRIKKLIVEKDEKEKNLRKILNLGHTFGHGFEAALDYSKKLNHGEAIILGILTSIRFSKKNKMIKIDDFNSISNHLDHHALPSEIKKYFSSRDVNKILTFMTKDKKNKSDKINLILLKKIGLADIKGEYSRENLKVFLKDELSN